MSRFSDELLKWEVVADLLGANVLVKVYRGYCSPHSALGYLAPAEFVAAADVGGKEENAGKTEDLESVLTLHSTGTENGVRTSQASGDSTAS